MASTYLCVYCINMWTEKSKLAGELGIATTRNVELLVYFLYYLPNYALRILVSDGMWTLGPKSHMS